MYLGEMLKRVQKDTPESVDVDNKREDSIVESAPHSITESAPQPPQVEETAS